MNKKLLSLFLMTIFLLTACNLPAPVPAATVTPPIAPLKAMDTPSTLSLPVVASPQILSLQMLDSDHGWAVGETRVLRTVDGGVTWLDATPAGLTSVGYSASYDFVNIDTAWLLNGGASPTEGTLYHTTDGGQTWTSTAVPFGGSSIQFADASNGWVLVGLGGGMSHEAVAVFRTTDGGSAWDQVFINDPTALNSTDTLPFVGDKNGITALDGNTAFVTGSQPSPDFIYLYRSSDGGVTWAQPAINMPSGYTGAMTNVFLPVFFGSQDGVLPVLLYSDTLGIVFYLSSDAGQTWTPTTPVVPYGKYSLLSRADFVVWDGGSSLFTSHDSGTTWSKTTTNVNLTDTLISFQFIDATTGWAVTGDASSHYSLYKTTDGGATWLPLIP